MDREHRHSSLPSSLIPHLFSGPQQPRYSHTRTTLQSEDVHVPQDNFPFDLHRRPFPPIHLPEDDDRRLPFPPSTPPHPSSSSSSSFPHQYPRPASYHEPAFSTFQRGSNLPLRVDPRASGAYRTGSPAFEHGPPFQDQLRHRGERDAYLSGSDHSWPDHHSVQSAQSRPGPSRLLDRSPENQSPSYVRRPSSDTGSLHRSADVGSNDGEGSQKGKRRRAESVIETDDNTKKTTRNPRKTAVACNFCRGRKLRCNGEKPSCYNCTVRKFECEYVPVQRRRGPGKAPKGSRSRRGGHSRGPGDRASAAVAEHELDSLAPEVRPYMSVLSLTSFGFQQPPPQSPQYQSAPGSMMHGRESVSRETSSEDRSDEEEEWRER